MSQKNYRSGAKALFSCSPLLYNCLQQTVKIQLAPIIDITSINIMSFIHYFFLSQNFYKDSRRDMYIRYISRLYDLHLMANNFVEAGLTLRLYANLLAWSAIALPAEMSYPSQTEARRKEELFNRILDCFDKGKVSSDSHQSK